MVYVRGDLSGSCSGSYDYLDGYSSSLGSNGDTGVRRNERSERYVKDSGRDI